MAKNNENNIIWFPDGEQFTTHPGVLSIETGLKDREGCWDLKVLMDFAVKNDNIIRLKPNDPNYDYLRIEILRLEKRKRKKEFPILINHCLEAEVLSKHTDEKGEYLYFDIIDHLSKVYTRKAYCKRQKEKAERNVQPNDLPKNSPKVSEKTEELSETLSKDSKTLPEVHETLLVLPETYPISQNEKSSDSSAFTAIDSAEENKKREDKKGEVGKEDIPVADPTLPYPPFPLLNNKIWHCPVSLYGEWKKKYFMVDLDERLQHYSDMYFDNSTKRQYESQIVHALEFYLEADEKKAEKENATEYQSIKNAISEAKETEREEATLSERLRSVNDVWVYLQENAPELFDGFCNGIKEYHDWETYVPYYRMKSIKEGNGSLATLEADTVHNALAVLKNADRLAQMQAICNKFPDNINYIFYDFCAKYHMNPDAVKEDFSFLEHNIRLKMEA